MVRIEFYGLLASCSGSLSVEVDRWKGGEELVISFARPFIPLLCQTKAGDVAFALSLAPRTPTVDMRTRSASARRASSVEKETGDKGS